MSALDRDKARTVLAKSTLVDMTNDEILDEIEASLIPSDAEAKLDRIKALLEQAIAALRRRGDGEQWWTDAAEACSAAENAFAILRTQ